MRTLLILTLLLGGCTTKPAPTPQFAGVARQAEEVAGSLDQARSDSKTVKSLHLDSMSLLDRLDYKAVLLLDRP